MKRKPKTPLPTHEELAAFLPSGSGFDEDFRCLGRRAMETRMPKEKESGYARRGQKIHTALAKDDLTELAESDQRTASLIMFDEAKLVEEHGFEGAETYWEPTDDEEFNRKNQQWMIPRLFDIDDNFNPLWSVQLDRLHLDHRHHRALIPDYKSGYGIPQPASNNWQLRAEATAVWMSFQHIEEFVCALLHPHHPEKRVDQITYTADDCKEFQSTIREYVRLIQLPDQPRTPNGISCQFCPARLGVCPEYKAWIETLATDIEAEIENEGFAGLLKRSPEQRAAHIKQLWDYSAHVEHILEKYTTMLAKDEKAIAGFSLRQKTDRKWENESKAIALAERKLGEQAITEAMVFSLTKLEKHLKEKHGKRRADEIMAIHFGKLIVYTKSRPWLVQVTK